ncbi:MAG: TonB-dependent siderophore receptor [Vicinamibacterales bacterium]
MKNTPFVRSTHSKRRRRGTARLFVLGAAFTASALVPGLATPAAAAPAQQGSAQGAQQTFAIAAGTIGSVAQAFEAATGIRVTLANDMIRDLPSAGVRGRFTAQQALDRLLAGTGVGAAFTSDTAVTLDIRTAEFVAVEGRTPDVNSPKFTQPLRDVPQTITVVPSSVIQAQGATTLRDVLRNVTGISIQAGEGGVPAGDNLSIRGFSARTDFFIDGIRDSGGYARDPFNVEQVEVVKGPSSSYSGRGSTGGSINLATKAPHLSAARSASIGLGSADYKRGTIDVNQPLAGGSALRLNAMWTDSETPGRDVVASERWGIAPSLAFGLGTQTRTTLSYSHLDQQNVPDYGIPWVPAANVPLSAHANRPAPVDFSNFYGLASRDYEDTKTDTVTAEVEHDFNSSVSLRTVARYGRTDRDSLITAPRFASNASTDVRRTDWKSRDQADAITAGQADLTTRFDTGRIGHTVVSGVEVARETSENWTRAELGGEQPNTDLFNPDPFQPYVSRLERDGGVTDAAAVSAAAYVFDTVALGSKVQLNGGVRVDRFSLDYFSHTAAGVDTRLDRVDTMASWRGGVVVKPRPEGSIYGGVGTSLNPSTEGLSLSANTAEVDPEKTLSLELGTKWDAFGGRLGMNAAAFRTAKTNARTPGINPGDPPTVLDGEHVVSGIEVGANGAITRGWQLFGSYTFMSSEITRSNNAAEVGNEFGNTPDHSFSLWSTFRLPGDVEVGGGVQYVGDRFNNNTAARLAPAYWLVDAMAAYRVSERLTLRVNGLNLGDERYIDRVGGGHFIPGPGRSVMLTADVGL